MSETGSKTFLQNLVLSELKNYMNIVNSYPSVNDDRHYAPLRSKKCAVYRAIHWYLLDKGFVFQEKLEGQKCDYSIAWKLKKFNERVVIEGILDKYSDYLEASINDLKSENIVNGSLDCFSEKNNIEIMESQMD